MDEKETRQKLLDSARREFTEKGYMKASLRNICKNAGVTTGALYFFFKDKEDLFSALVNEPLQRIFSTMMEHYQWEKGQVNQKTESAHPSTAGFDFDKMNMGDHHEKEEITSETGMNYREELSYNHTHSFQQIIHDLYLYREEFLLLLTKSQGSSFENAVDRFIEVAEVQLRMLSDQLCDHNRIPRAEDHMIHWIAHLQIEFFVYMLTHVETEQEALKYTEKTIKYMLGGWFAMFQP